ERMLADVERSSGVKVTHTDLLVAIVARTLAKHPRLNASWTEGGIVPHEEVNVALAMAVDNAVVTAVIPRADRASVADIATRRRDLAERARRAAAAGRYRGRDLYDQQPRDVRRRRVHGDHRAAAGGYPGGRRDRGSRGGRERPAGRPSNAVDDALVRSSRRGR